MRKRMLVLLSLFAPLAANAKLPCAGMNSSDCAAQFARNMTSIIAKFSTGRGPFQLVKVTSSGNDITMIYRGPFTSRDFPDYLAKQNTTKKDFLAFTRADFVVYQCDGPIRNYQSRAIRFHNVLTFSDGAELESFDLHRCPSESDLAATDSPTKLSHVANQVLQDRHLSIASGPPPAYPVDALKARHQGVVKVRATIGPDGKVLDVSVSESSGYTELDQAAVDAVWKWKFLPGLHNGVEVGGVMEFPVSFSLSK